MQALLLLLAALLPGLLSLHIETRYDYIVIFKKGREMSCHENSEVSSLSLMHQLVNDEKIPSLRSNLAEQFFPVTELIPQSLTYNLISDNRVVKLIKNGHAMMTNVLRGFYYQLFKLCFEMEDHQNSKNYLEIMKNMIFDRSLAQVNGNQIHYKHLGEFLVMMEDDDSVGFQEGMAKYHEVDEALLAILQQISQGTSSIEGDNQVEGVLTELCELFEITLISNQPYYHFQESNVYLYVENEERCYVVFDQSEEEGEEQEGEENQGESLGSGHLRSNIRSQISASDGSKSKNLSQLTQNKAKTDGNFSKQYTFQPEYQTSNKNSEVSHSVTSKDQNSRPASDNSHKSHLSNESQYKRQQLNYRYEAKEEVKSSQSNSTKNNQRLQVPESQPASSHDPFKKGAYKISNPYEISSPSNYSQAKVELPISQKYGSHYYSPSPVPSPTNHSAKEKPLVQSHVSSSLSSYYEGYYAEIPHNHSIQSSKNDTIINLFGDMLKSGKYEGNYNQENINRPAKRPFQQTEKILETQQQFQKQDSSDIYPNFIKKTNKLDNVDMMVERAKSVNSVNQHNSDFNSNGSKTFQYSVAEKTEVKEGFGYYQERKNYSSIEEKTLYVEPIASNIQTKTYQKQATSTFDQDQTIFYKPKKSQLKVISEVPASKQSITLSKNNEADDSKGSIYRQFSDTRILKLLKQPHKTKVQIMRNRFKGQHFNL